MILYSVALYIFVHINTLPQAGFYPLLVEDNNLLNEKADAPTNQATMNNET